MKRTLTLLAAAAVAAAFAASAGATPRSADVVIRHQLVGCHAWSVNGSAFRAKQTARVGAGGSLVVVDDDVMSHKLIETGGPAKVAISSLASAMGTMATTLKGPGVMAHMGAALRVRFPRAGTYTFTTKEGEDYMKGIVTKGPDNVLRLTVKVA